MSFQRFQKHFLKKKNSSGTLFFLFFSIRPNPTLVLPDFSVFTYIRPQSYLILDFHID